MISGFDVNIPDNSRKVPEATGLSLRVLTLSKSASFFSLLHWILDALDIRCTLALRLVLHSGSNLPLRVVFLSVMVSPDQNTADLTRLTGEVSDPA